MTVFVPSLQVESGQVELEYKRSQTGHKVGCLVESNRHGWRWDVQIRKGDLNITIDLSQLNNVGTVSCLVRTNGQIADMEDGANRSSIWETSVSRSPVWT